MSTENVSPEIYFENTTWELISQNRVLMGAGNGHNGGDTIEAGLPNITGSFDPSWGSFMWAKGTNSGAFDAPSGGAHEHYTNYFGDSDDPSAPIGTAGLVFDASRSSAIYGRSTTVQPPAFYVYMWRRAS